MNNDTFYGTTNSSTVTYLEFGEIDLSHGEKKVWDFRLHQKAYDWLMLGRYANDLLAYNNMSHELDKNSLEDAFEIYNTEIHHPNDSASNLDKLVAISLMQQHKKDVSFFELGQTVFGCIEGILFCQHLLNFCNVPFRPIDPKSISWHGVDISELFNFLAIKLHQDLSIHTATEYDKTQKPCDIFFAKGISLLYAIRGIDHLFDLIDRSQLAIFDYSLTLGPAETTTIGSGKNVLYLNLDQFLSKYQQTDKKLLVKKKSSKMIAENNRIWLDCLYATEDLCRGFKTSHEETNDNMCNALKAYQNGNRFLDSIKDNGWISIEEFLRCNSLS